MKAIQKQPDAWIEQAPTRCSGSREIAASPTAIWDVLSDHESWPEWFTTVQDITVTGAASGVGAERHVRLRGLELDEEIVAWDVGERFGYSAVALSRGFFDSLNGRITIEDRGSGRSLVTYTQGFAPRGWFRLPFKLVQGQFRRSLVGGLKGLAARVE